MKIQNNDWNKLRNDWNNGRIYTPERAMQAVKAMDVGGENAKRFFLLWRCAPSSEVRGRRADHEGGCMKWAIRSVKHLPTAKNQVQAKCVACGRRPRLEPAIITLFYDRESAEAEMNKRNHQGGLL
jgi:hypothetical protein